MSIKFQADNTDFFKQLRKDVDLYFKSKNLKPTGGVKLWLKTAVILGGLTGIYLWLVAFSPYSWWLCITLYGVLGLVVALIGFNLMHDGSHGSYSDNKLVNKLMAYSLNLLGGNSLFWGKKHNINHHTFTNIEMEDDDIDLKPFMRLHKEQRRRWFHKYQHIYAVLLYGFTYLMWIYILDFKKYFTGKITESSPIPKMNLKEHLVFWLSKLIHLGVFVVVPVIVLGIEKALVGYFVAAFVTGFVIAVIFQLAHIIEGVHFITPQDTSVKVDIKTEWAIHQVNTTANFATNNKVLTWMLGGLNYQMVHHLFPTISHVHYPALRPIILKKCKEYNLQYVEFPKLSSAVLSHLRHLKETGKV